MKLKESELKKLSFADLKVLSDENTQQYPNYTPGSPEYNYHIHLVEAIAAEKAERISKLVEKDEDEKTEGEKAEDAK